MSSPLSPQFYLIRPESKQTTTSGRVTYSIVPLIPADQFPEWLEIVGVPRTLHHQQANKMSSVGIVPRDAGFYSVQIMGSDPPHSPPPSFSWPEATPFAHVPITSGDEHDPSSSTPDEEIHHEDQEANTHWNMDIQPADSTVLPGEHDPWPLPISGPISQIEERIVQDQGDDDITPISSPPSSPSIHITTTPTTSSSHDTPPTQSTTSSPPPNPGESSTSTNSLSSSQPPQPSPQSRQPYRGYCLHWCLHGICKWGPRCKFLHEMPETAEGFSAVGLTGFPRWYSDLMRGVDGTEGPEHAGGWLYVKADAGPQKFRGKSCRKGGGSSFTPGEGKRARGLGVGMCMERGTVGGGGYMSARERREGGGKSVVTGMAVVDGGDSDRNAGTMMEQLGRPLGGIDLGGGGVTGRRIEPEMRPLWQRRPPHRTRGPRDHLRIAAIGDGEPVALGGYSRGHSHVAALGVHITGGGEKLFGGGRRMGKWKWKRELEQKGKEKVMVNEVKEATKADGGDVDLLSFSD